MGYGLDENDYTHSDPAYCEDCGQHFEQDEDMELLECPFCGSNEVTYE